MEEIRTSDWLRYVVEDLIRFVLVPFLAAVMPRRLAAAWLTLASKWRWILPKRDQARAAIDRCFENRSISLERIALTLLNESTTAWKLLIGRRLHVRQHGNWPERGAFVAVGGHFGSGLSVLWSLQRAGLQPSFVLRHPPACWRRSRPIYYYWSIVRLKLIKRLCNGNVIVTGGARRKLKDALASSSITPVILFDTPAAVNGSNWSLRVGNAAISIPCGGCDMVTASAMDVVLFLPLTNVSEVDAELYLQPLDLNIGLSEEFPNKFGQALAKWPEEWHFWSIIQPFLHRRR